MAAGDHPAAGDTPSAASAVAIDRWLAELELEPIERAEREGVVSWDLILDGRRRFDIRVTLILAPAVGLVGWVHYAPALSDAFRKSYRRFLRWNDELPFTKFALAEDERVVLTSEVAPESIDRERLGLTLARLLTICDLLLDESAHWLWTGGRMPSTAGRTSRGLTLLERYAAELAELTPSAAEPAPPSTGEPTGPEATADEDEADDDSNGDPDDDEPDAR